MGEEAIHQLEGPGQPAAGIETQGRAVLGRYASALRGQARGAASGALPSGVVALASLGSAAMLFLLPERYPLPWQLTLGAWAPLPRPVVSLSYSYDAVSHLFTFLGVVVVGSVLASPATWRAVGGRGGLLLLLALLSFVQVAAVSDLVVLYVAWELSGWIAWLVCRTFSGGDDGWQVPRLATVASYGLLMAAMLLVASGGSAQLAPAAARQPPEAILLLLLLAAAARAAQVSFQSRFSAWATVFPPAAVALIGGVYATGGALLLARALQLSVGAWPAGTANVALGLTLAAVLAGSVLAWRTRLPAAALIYVAAADLGLVLVGMIAGTPATLGAGLLLLLANGLALAALVAAPRSALARGKAGVTLLERSGLLAAAVAMAALIGFPPLLGFNARWQLFAGLWEGQHTATLGILVLATIPRNIALLRAAKWLIAMRPAVPLSRPPAWHARIGPAAMTPGLLVVGFSVLPALPERYLVGPAVAAIKGLPLDAAGGAVALGLPAAVGGAVLALAALAMAVYYVPEARTVCGQAGELFRMPAGVAVALEVLGALGRRLVAGLGAPIERLGALAPRVGDAAVECLARHGAALAPWLEERQYLAAILLVGISVVLVLAG